MLAADETELSSDFGGTGFDKSDFMACYHYKRKALDVIRDGRRTLYATDVYVDAHT